MRDYVSTYVLSIYIMGFIDHTCPTVTATEQVKSLGLLTALLATAEEAVATLVSTSEDVATFG